MKNRLFLFLAGIAVVLCIGAASIPYVLISENRNVRLLGASNYIANLYGSAANLTGIPSVNGTSNYLAKFSGTNTLTNSAIYEVGGNTGIGTTNPSGKLDIYSGDGVYASPTTVRISGTAGGNHEVIGSIDFFDNIISYNNVQAQIKGIHGLNDGKAGQLGFFTAAPSTGTLSERMVIDESGNVGIGTTLPAQRFTVYSTSGSPATSGTTQNGIVKIANNDNNGALFLGQYTATGNSWIQAASRADLSVNNVLALNPNGGNVTVGGTLIATNGLQIIAPTNGVAPPTQVVQPIGLFASMMMRNRTNTITMTTQDVYYQNPTYDTVRTNGCIADPAAGTLTNLTAGFYRVSYYVSMVPSANDLIEGEIFVNGTGREEIALYTQYDNPPRVRTMGGDGILYLAANSRVEIKFNNRTASGHTLAVWRGALTIGTP
jgi:hypothetical protein